MEKVKLGQLTNIKTGRLDVNAENPNGKYPFFTCSKNHTYIDEYAFDGESVLVAGNGDLNVKYYNGKFNAYQRTYVIQANENLNGKFLYYFLDSYVEKLREQSIGGVIKYIKLGNLTDAEIPLPNLATQQRIAAILDQADAIIQNNRAIVQKYDALTQSLFLDMFGDPVKNEKGWKVKSLGDITNLITDGKHGNCNDEKDSGYYFISAKDVKNNLINYTDAREIPKIEFEEVDKRTNLQPGDLVMINTGATIGRMAIAKDIPETRKTTFQKSVAVIKVKNDIISSFYLQYVLELGIITFANMGSGSAIKNLLLSEMRRFKIILPNLELQNQFAERVAMIEAQKQQAQLELAKSEELFNSLLQKAFKGELS